MFHPLQQRDRKRRNSDRSEDCYHSDGDYPEQEYREEPGEEKESKTIMLRGLSLHITEGDVSFSALHSRPVCHVVWLAAIFSAKKGGHYCIAYSAKSRLYSETKGDISNCMYNVK